MKPNLIYTIAIDPPGHGGTRQMAKMLAASLARTYFGGDVIVFRNSPHPLFLTQRHGIEEIYIEVPEADELAQDGTRSAEWIGRPWLGKNAESGTRNADFSRLRWRIPPAPDGISSEGVTWDTVDQDDGTRGDAHPPFAGGLTQAEPRELDPPVKAASSQVEWSKARADALARVAMSWKYRARHQIDASRYGWVMFIDADCLALRNLDHLLANGEPSRVGWRVPLASAMVSPGSAPRGATGAADYGPPAPGLFEKNDADILYQPEPGRSAGQDVFSAYAEECADASPGSENFEAMGAAMDRGVDSLGTSDLRLGDGINSGTWAVRGEHYQAVMEAWEAIEATPPQHLTQWTEQGAWNRLIAECGMGRAKFSGTDKTLAGRTPAPASLTTALGKLAGLRAAPFEPGEVQFPLHQDMDWKRYKEAALLHAVGGTTKEKIEFLFGMFMQRFYGDPATTLVNILEM